MLLLSILALNSICSFNGLTNGEFIKLTVNLAVPFEILNSDQHVK